ncbi:hypothetical protein [Nocardia sp. MH4]|uniref:hypothetical protein n=1 Tax=Nocardia sp. MH4 TaxID=1768677 RepID=UPI001C501A5F|nr:hypothetical protein [Nocardia sp. MH4]
MSAVRTFEFRRDRDLSGVSGTGVVADGVVFDDGTTVVHWRGEHRSTVVWPSVEAAIAVHGHDGATRLVYTGLSAVAVMFDQIAQNMQAAADRRTGLGRPLTIADSIAFVDEHAIESAAIVRAEFDDEDGADRA